MIVYVHSYDIFDAGVTFGRHARESPRHITLGASDSMADIVARIQADVGGARRIWTLILNAHGLVEPIHHRPTGGLSLSDVATLDAASAEELAPLAPFFTPGGNGVEIHGCAILGNRRGWRMCRRLAQLLGVSIYASPFNQRGSSPWWSSTPSDTFGRFELSVFAFRPPDGREENVSEDFRRRGLL